jgi:lipoprotein-anchoring transpeptidase ErfK/SrfK
MGRASSFHHDVATLERSWTHDVHEGVPASSIAHYSSPESAQYAMEFLRGGFFIHDAPWEPSSAFGPGSQNGVDASHGCVHIPTPTMAWLYAWSPIGTTVIIHG